MLILLYLKKTKIFLNILLNQALIFLYTKKLDNQVTEHLPRFIDIRGRYEQYQRFIKEVLHEASRRYAPLAIVDARTKTIPGFVDKILRKREKYANDKSSLPKDPCCV
jgi:hypothetical protein